MKKRAEFFRGLLVQLHYMADVARERSFAPLTTQNQIKLGFAAHWQFRAIDKLFSVRHC